MDAVAKLKVWTALLEFESIEKIKVPKNDCVMLIWWDGPVYFSWIWVGFDIVNE